MPFDWLSQMLGGVEGVFGWIVGADDSSYALSRWLFLRALGVVALIAFVSFWVQATGLIGSRGILPLEPYLRVVRRQIGRERFRLLPTLLWLAPGDRGLHLVCGSGVVLSILLIANVAPALVLVLLWLAYLSLAVAGREFTAFQWDALLVETALLGAMLAPWVLVPGGAVGTVSPIALFLVWWLLFRLNFQSGVVKLTSGDPTWRRLTALDYHYFTQPLPTWPAWYMHQLPSTIKKLSVLLTYVIEIGFPFLLFGTRTMRLAGCAGIVLLQLTIMGTGNYTFFNLLTITLVIPLLDDRFWRNVLPDEWTVGPGGVEATMTVPWLQTLLVSLLAALVLVVTAARLWRSLWPASDLPAWLRRLIHWLEPFRSINGYGLFRVMTTRRPEIIVEGSDDAATWEPYAFRYKPGEPSRRPRFVEPHQPRLDWQMWFAALGTYRQTPWFETFLARLLEGSPAVARLLRHTPGTDRPARYIRAMLYHYEFTGWRERRETGHWWRRVPLGPYSPVLALPPGRGKREG